VDKSDEKDEEREQTDEITVGVMKEWSFFLPLRVRPEKVNAERSE
jgi:hypothetical protein